VNPTHQSIEAEQAVLGSLLISQAAWTRISDKLSAADFYRADHKTIFAAIASLNRDGKVVDVVSVGDYLERGDALEDAGGFAYIGRLAHDTISADHVDTYAALVLERSALRKFTAVGDSISTFADCLLQVCAERFAGFTFEDFGDPAGQQRSAMTADKAEKTCFDILAGKGIRIQAAEQNVTIRLESVRKPLNTLRNGKPQLQLHPRCQMLRKGFAGRYQYRRIMVSGSAERFHDAPEKNSYSHPHDALQYVATHVFGDSVRGREERMRDFNTPLEKLYPDQMKVLSRGIV
jgi:hypothetical protein